MAGGYEHILAMNGDLGHPGLIAAMLDNDSTVFGTIEQMYGMIWYLAETLVTVDTGFSQHSDDQARYRKEVKAAVEEARDLHPRGLELAREINGR